MSGTQCHAQVTNQMSDTIYSSRCLIGKWECNQLILQIHRAFPDAKHKPSSKEAKRAWGTPFLDPLLTLSQSLLPLPRWSFFAKMPQTGERDDKVRAPQLALVCIQPLGTCLYSYLSLYVTVRYLILLASSFYRKHVLLEYTAYTIHNFSLYQFRVIIDLCHQSHFSQ